MKTIYLREKRTGNFEITVKGNSTHKFSTKKSFVEFFKNDLRTNGGSRLIKATYSRSQTYFCTSDEVFQSIKSNERIAIMNAERIALYSINGKVKNSFKNKAIEDVKKNKEANQELVSGLLNAMTEAKEGEDKQKWQAIANKLVQTIGHDFIQLVGWKNILTIAKQ